MKPEELIEKIKKIFQKVVVVRKIVVLEYTSFSDEVYSKGVKIEVYYTFNNLKSLCFIRVSGTIDNKFTIGRIISNARYEVKKIKSK